MVPIKDLINAVLFFFKYWSHIKLILKSILKFLGVAQNHSTLFMSSRERLPGLLHGQIYTYPSKRWRKKRRQYLMHYLHPKRGPRGDTEDGSEGVETITHVNDDSKESVGLKGI